MKIRYFLRPPADILSSGYMRERIAETDVVIIVNPTLSCDQILTALTSAFDDIEANHTPASIQ